MSEPVRHDAADDIADKAFSILFRYDCPQPIELGEYHLGLVGEPRRAWIREHLGACPLCVAEMSTLKTFMAQPDAVEQPVPQPGILEKIQWLIAEWIQPQAGPQFALRGAVDALQIYRAGAYEINLEFNEDRSHPGHMQVVGLVLGIADGPATIGLTAPAGIVILDSVSLDEAGNFTFVDIAPGKYDLIVLPADGSAHIRIPNLDITA